MAFELTEHARDALAKRGIEPAWVAQVVNNPEKIVPDPVDNELEHCLARVPDFGNRVLRVIMNTAKEPPHVVTAFFDRRGNIL